MATLGSSLGTGGPASSIIQGNLTTGLTSASSKVGQTDSASQIATVNPQSSYTANALTQFPYDLLVLNTGQSATQAGQSTSASTTTFGMLFMFYKYSRPSIINSPTLVPYGSILLPLPSDLVDRQQLYYSEEKTPLALGAALNQIAGSETGITNNIASVALDGIKNLGITALNNLANVIGSRVGLGNDLTRQVLSISGITQNPFLTVLFNNPVFKRHVFTWTFIPENANDSANLRYILNKFRFHSLPSYNNQAGNNLLFNYPDMCLPILFPIGYLYDFQLCVIENIMVNYAPGDSASFHSGTLAPNCIKLTMNLLEIQIWVQEDISVTSTGITPGQVGSIPSPPGSS